MAELAPRFTVGIRQEHLLFLQDARMGDEANRRKHKLAKQPTEEMSKSKCQREHKGTELQEGGGVIQGQVPGIREEHGSKVLLNLVLIDKE